MNERWSNPKEIKNYLCKLSDTTPCNNSSLNTAGCGTPLYYDGSLYCDNSERHHLFLGSSGIGKTSCATVSTVISILKSKESLIVVDPKGELYQKTACYIGEEYNKKVINFRDIYASDGFNILQLPYELYCSEDAKDKQLASEIIEDLAHSLYPISSEKDSFWALSARSLFIASVYCVFECANQCEINLLSVFNLIAKGDNKFGFGATYLDELARFLPAESPALIQLKSYITTAQETKAGIRSVFMEGISNFLRSKELIKMLSNDDLNIGSIDGSDPMAVFIILPDETPVYDSICGVLLGQLTSHLIRSAHLKHNGCLPLRVHIILEELASIGNSLPNLPHLMSAARSRNVKMYLVLQSLSQLDKVFGHSNATTILANVGTTVAFSTNDWETLVELSRKCGERDIDFGNRISREPLITPTRLGAMEIGQALILIRGRIKYITKLPFYSKVFNLSDWHEPNIFQNKRVNLVASFDVEKFVKEKKKEILMKQSLQDVSANEIKIPINSNQNDFLNKSLSEMLFDTKDSNTSDNTTIYDFCITGIGTQAQRVADILSQYSDKDADFFINNAFNHLPFSLIVEGKCKAMVVKKNLLFAGASVIVKEKKNKQGGKDNDY